MRRLLFAVAVCTLLLCPAGPSVLASGPTYTLKNLGTVSGIVPHVTGVNASGAVSGWYTNATGGDRAVRYTDDAGWTAIPGLESLTSYAFGINDRGDIVGYAILASGEIRAFRYTVAGGLEYIDPLEGGGFTVGSGISNTGEITGYGNSTNGIVAYRQSPHLLAQPIDTLGGGFSGGCGINDAGQVAGIAMTTTGLQHGFRAAVDGTVGDIPGIGGADMTNSACAIDSDGSVTGQAQVSGSIQHAFLYNGTNVVDLDSFGSPSSNGLAIAGGVVVGNYALPDNSATRAFMHSTATGTVDLNTLGTPAGWILTSATGVNSRGGIVGEGTLNGKAAVWMLTSAADTTPPTITSLSVTPSTLKPNNKMVTVAVSVTAVDDIDPQPFCAITSIDATEANVGDGMILSAVSASLLATKDSRGNTRTYTLTVTCGDSSQNKTTGEVNVTVESGKSTGTLKHAHVASAPWKGNNK